jgi:predicted 3-demethylubiquinone-9 3-methyltransferase (glyoxalase superfamily)
MKLAGPITPCLWFDKEAEEAATFYVSIFPDSKLGEIAYYGNEGNDIHGQKAGTVMTVDFELNGQKFLAMNAGPIFKFNEAVSLQVFCETQREIDHFWNRLTEGGQEVQCGWLKDKFGLSWQIVPAALSKMMRDSDRRKSERVMKAFMQMKKYDIAALERAYAGEAA